MGNVSTKYLITRYHGLYHTSVPAQSSGLVSLCPLLCEQCASNTCLNKAYSASGSSNDCWDGTPEKGGRVEQLNGSAAYKFRPGLNIYWVPLTLNAVGCISLNY